MPEKGKLKIAFAALPVRAMSDQRLSATHFRILAAVAFYDRLSGPRAKGAGCYASNKTLAQRANVNYNNFSTAVNELGRWGYVTAEPHPMNKRTRVYRVIYGENSSPIGEVSNANNASPIGEPSSAPNGGKVTADTSPEDEANGQMLRPPDEQVHDNAQPSDDIYIQLSCNRFCETETNSPKGRASDESAINLGLQLLQKKGLQNDASPNTGGNLAIIERALTEGGKLDAPTERYLQQVADAFDVTDANCLRAQRILEQHGTAA